MYTSDSVSTVSIVNTVGYWLDSRKLGERDLYLKTRTPDQIWGPPICLSLA